MSNNSYLAKMQRNILTFIVEQGGTATSSAITGRTGQSRDAFLDSFKRLLNHGFVVKGAILEKEYGMQVSITPLGRYELDRALEILALKGQGVNSEALGSLHPTTGPFAWKRKKVVVPPPTHGCHTVWRGGPYQQGAGA